MMDNSITCWIGINDNLVITPHSIFDYHECIEHQSVTASIDWSSAVAMRETADHGWNFMAKWIKKVCVSDDPFVLAEILRQSKDYNVGALSVFANKKLFDEMMASGVCCSVAAISPHSTVSLPAYHTEKTEPIGNGRYLHRLEPTPLADIDEDSLNAEIGFIESGMNQPKLSTSAQNSITRNLSELEQINLEDCDDDYEYGGGIGISPGDSTDRAIVRMSDILDDVCNDVNRFDNGLKQLHTELAASAKQAKAAVILSGNAMSQMEKTSTEFQERIDGIVEQISVIVNDLNSHIAKTHRRVMVLAVVEIVIVIMAIVAIVFSALR